MHLEYFFRESQTQLHSSGENSTNKYLSIFLLKEFRLLFFEIHPQENKSSVKSPTAKFTSVSLLNLRRQGKHL